MDVSLSESELMLQETAKQLAGDLSCGSVTEIEVFDRSQARKILDATGFLSLRLPSDAGGGDGTTLELAIVVEALASRLVPLPFLGRALAMELLMAAGAPVATLERVGTGRLQCTLGLTADLSRLASGSAGRVVSPDAADAEALIMLESGDSPRLRAVRPDSVSRGTDITRLVARADAANEVDVGDLGGPLGSDELRRFHARALVLSAADLLGLMTAALDTAVTHARNRRQFGVPIGTFQALQHLAADQLVSLEGARSLVEYAAWAADEPDLDQALMAAQAAKAYASRAGRTLGEAVVQMHGGMGITWECTAHLYLKRALVDGALFGDYNAQIADLTAARLRRAG
jgi:alkylation response protein AidB-like acyl-CoA dehydrogenase